MSSDIYGGQQRKKFQDTSLSNENKKGFISIPIIMSWAVLFVLGGELSFGLKSKQAWFYICGPATTQASNAKPFALSNQFGPQVCQKNSVRIVHFRPKRRRTFSQSQRAVKNRTGRVTMRKTVSFGINNFFTLKHLHCITCARKTEA